MTAQRRCTRNRTAVGVWIAVTVVGGIAAGTTQTWVYVGLFAVLATTGSHRD